MTSSIHPTSSPTTSPTISTGRDDRFIRRWFGVLAEAQTYRNLAYLLIGLPLGTIWFSVLTTGLAVGASLVVVALVGIPVLLGLGYASRAFANTERITANALLSTRLDPAPFGPHGAGNPWRRLRFMIGDEQRRRELWFVILRFPAGVATFVLAVTALTVPFALAYAPVSARIDGDEPFGGWSHGERLEDIFDAAWSWAALPIAAISLVAALHLINAVARACARWAERSLRTTDEHSTDETHPPAGRSPRAER